MKTSNLRAYVFVLILILIIGEFILGFGVSNANHKLFLLSGEMLDKYEEGEIDQVKQLIQEADSIYKGTDFLRKVSIHFSNCYDYLNTSHSVKGRMAIDNDDLEDAKSHLRKSAMVKSTPTLYSFGPNMSLARDLLKIGEKEVVLAYLDACKEFWELENGRIDEWKAQIRQGEIPDFKGNLRY